MTDVRALLRDEIALARIEMRDQANRARLALMTLGAAATALMLGAVFLLVAAATAIAELMDWPVWAGFLMVALLLGVGAAVTFSVARMHLRKLHAVPPQTMSTLKENAEWIAKRLSSARK